MSPDDTQQPALPSQPPATLTARERAIQQGWAVDPHRSQPPPHRWSQCPCGGRPDATLFGCPCHCHGEARTPGAPVPAPKPAGAPGIRRWGRNGAAPKLRG